MTFILKASKADGDNINVSKVMDTWTLQMGFPVVNVTSKSNTIKLTQQRFLADPDANQSDTKFKSPYGYVFVDLNSSLSVMTEFTLPKFLSSQQEFFVDSPGGNCRSINHRFSSLEDISYQCFKT